MKQRPYLHNPKIFTIRFLQEAFASLLPGIMRFLNDRKKSGWGIFEQFLGLMRPRIPVSRSFQCSISSGDEQEKKPKCAPVLQFSLKQLSSRGLWLVHPQSHINIVARGPLQLLGNDRLLLHSLCPESYQSALTSAMGSILTACWGSFPFIPSKWLSNIRVLGAILAPRVISQTLEQEDIIVLFREWARKSLWSEKKNEQKS